MSRNLPEGVKRWAASGFRMVEVPLSSISRHPDTYVRTRDLPSIEASLRAEYEGAIAGLREECGVFERSAKRNRDRADKAEAELAEERKKPLGVRVGDRTEEALRERDAAEAEVKELREMNARLNSREAEAQMLRRQAEATAKTIRRQVCESLAQEFERRVDDAKKVRAALKGTGRGVIDACIAEREKAAQLCRQEATKGDGR